MLKRFYSILFIAIVCFNTIALAQSAGKSDESKITKAEAQEAQDLAKKITARFFETKDLTPLLDEFYIGDFIDRYQKFHSKDEKDVDITFVPGLTYDAKVVGEVSSAEWRRFYVSAHSFFLLAVAASLKNTEDNSDFDVDKFYSPSVLALLDKNPNLANMIEQKRDYKSVGSAEELRGATDTLEQALTIVREKQGNSPLLKIDEKELTKIFKEDYYQPELHIVDVEQLGFPKETRFIVIKTPIGMQLLLVNDKGKLKIAWTGLNA